MDTPTPQDIAERLSKSDAKNTVADFYNNIMAYDPEITSIYKNEAWKIARTQMGECISFENIFSYIIDPSVGIGLPHITFELCDETTVQYMCYDLLNFYFVKYATYASNRSPSVNYAVTTIGAGCHYEDDMYSGHQISVIISTKKRQITIFEPNTNMRCVASSQQTGTLKNFISVYNMLNNKKVLLDNGESYSIICPCTMNEHGIQELLSAPIEEREFGSCSIISLLIAHISIYTQNSTTIVSEIESFINTELFVNNDNNETTRRRVLFVDSYLNYISKTIIAMKPTLSKDEHNIDRLARFSKMSLTRGLLEDLKYANILNKKDVDNYVNMDMGVQWIDSTNNKLRYDMFKKLLIRNARVIEPITTEYTSRVNRLLERIPNKNNSTRLPIRASPTATNTRRSFMGIMLPQRRTRTPSIPLPQPNSTFWKLYGTFEFDRKHYFKIFIDDENVIWINEIDNKIKLKFTDENVFIDTYYANDKEGPNLTVLRAMLKNFSNVIINDDTKIRTDDYRDVPYSLWPFVNYTESQFYRLPDLSDKPTNIQSKIYNNNTAGLWNQPNRFSMFSEITSSSMYTWYIKVLHYLSDDTLYKKIHIISKNREHPKSTLYPIIKKYRLSEYNILYDFSKGLYDSLSKTPEELTSLFVSTSGGKLNKALKEKAKALKEKTKAKALKEKTKAKALKEKAKAKAKAKALKEKTKAKALKEKAKVLLHKAMERV